MRVERSTVDQVKNRLQSASKRKWDPLMTKKLDAMEGWLLLLLTAPDCSRADSQTFVSIVLVSHHTDYEKKLKAAEEEEARVKRQKKEQKKAKKLGKSTSDQDSADNSDETATDKKSEAADEEVPDADAEMMAMMGFGGFGGSKKS
ncbi:unnamed protein product [Phytophthora lilii]|uniref:Unnamed protein product n=1 Tax=Phytophthora lilii TaxID=2077276 RepID=A0A9W6WPI3_9STRA|nr:unnamed protein product [Phytophthora lilii]